MRQLSFGLLLSLITICKGNKLFNVNNNDIFIVKNHEKSIRNGIDSDKITNVMDREVNEIGCDINGHSDSLHSSRISEDSKTHIDIDLNNGVDDKNNNEHIYSNNINNDDINMDLDSNVNSRNANLNSVLREEIVISAMVESKNEVVVSTNRTSLFSR
jgi:hypothetical protein